MSVVNICSEFLPERGTRHIIASFFDEKREDMTPNIVKWTLSGEGGVIINDRLDVIVSPDENGDVCITLSDDDLQIFEAESKWPKVKRQLLVYYEYNSDYGDNLPDRSVYCFEIENLTGVS